MGALHKMQEQMGNVALGAAALRQNQREADYGLGKDVWKTSLELKKDSWTWR